MSMTTQQWLPTISTCPLIWADKQSTWEAETCFSSSKKMTGGGLLQTSSPHIRRKAARFRNVHRGFCGLPRTRRVAHNHNQGGSFIDRTLRLLLAAFMNVGRCFTRIGGFLHVSNSSGLFMVAGNICNCICRHTRRGRGRRLPARSEVARVFRKHEKVF